MQVQAVEAGWAQVAGRGERKRVNCVLLPEPPAVGDWLLVFIDGAREALSPARAAEVNATLDLVAAAMGGWAAGAQADAAFALPSAMDPAQLAALTGGPAVP
ncbi:HypC/HybG/HupF family hydrogenase formation chaperone [Ideonella livida]